MCRPYIYMSIILPTVASQIYGITKENYKEPTSLKEILNMLCTPFIFFFFYDIAKIHFRLGGNIFIMLWGIIINFNNKK